MANGHNVFQMLLVSDNYVLTIANMILTVHSYRARQLYKNISMLFLFPVKDGKLSTCVIAIFNASCYG